MASFVFEDDLSGTDFRKTSAYDIQTELGYRDIRIRSKFQSNFLKEQDEIHKLRLELDRVANYRYETVRDCRRQLKELHEQAETRRAAQKHARETAVLDATRRTKEMEEEINRQSREHRAEIDRLKKRKTQVHSQIALLKEQREEAKMLHQTRVVKLRDALNEFREDIKEVREREDTAIATSDRVTHEIEQIEGQLTEATAKWDSLRTVLEDVRTDLGKMKTDYTALRGVS
jgi:chromosome segregation ATPase